MKKPKDKTDKTLERVCPFVSSPAEDCYCVKMNSDKIKDVAEFCIGKYLGCRVYEKLVGRARDGNKKWIAIKTKSARFL